MQGTAQVVSIVRARTSKSRTKDRSPAADIVSGLRADGLLPFRVSLSLEEAFPLAYYLRDVAAPWGSSGALAPPDLQAEPCFSAGPKARQPKIPSQAAQRVELARSQMRDHEIAIFQWMDEARGRSNVTLAMAGAEWCPFLYEGEKENRAVATGMLKAACRTLAVAYKFPAYHNQRPPSR